MSPATGFTQEIAGIGHNSAPAFQDRPYQTEAVDSIWSYFATNSGNPVLAMPTGTGKSVVIARFLQSVFNAFPHQRVMILTHVKELIQQNFEKLLTLWPFAPAGIYSAGLNSKDSSKPITFAGIASVAKKAKLFGRIDLIIIDEAHLVSPSEATMYQAFIAALREANPYLKVIGLTATPWRLGHGHITWPSTDKHGNDVPSMFTDVCFDITTLEAFNRLIGEGYLCPLVPKKTSTILSTDGLHMRGGEYIEGEMQAQFDKEELTRAALNEAVTLGEHRRKWLIFGSGTEHCDHIADMLNLEFDIPTGVVHSKRAGRDETIRAFREGRIRAIVNNNMLTTGFDDPEIDLILCLRATASAVLWGQLLGRGTRPLYGIDGRGTAPDGSKFDLSDIGGRFAAIEAGGKISCLVLDYAGNTRRLGPINDPVLPRRKGEKGGTAPVKECPVCENYCHASVRYCGGQPFQTALGCGHEFVFGVKFKDKAATDELIKGEMPIVEVFKVDHITYSEHTKHDTPPMMKATYYSGLRSFQNYFCIEHQNYAQRVARKLWTELTDIPFPATTEQALELSGKLRAPTHIRVWLNDKKGGKSYPRIMAYCYDGSAFGEQEVGSTPPPEVETEKPRGAVTLGASFYADLDDDVPF
jgi:DNA repair protein RadD